MQSRYSCSTKVNSSPNNDQWQKSSIINDNDLGPKSTKCAKDSLTLRSILKSEYHAATTL